MARLNLDSKIDLIARDPEFAAEQLKISLAHLQQILQATNRQAVSSCLAQDSSLSTVQRRLLAGREEVHGTSAGEGSTGQGGEGRRWQKRSVAIR